MMFHSPAENANDGRIEVDSWDPLGLKETLRSPASLDVSSYEGADNKSSSLPPCPCTVTTKDSVNTEPLWCNKPFYQSSCDKIFKFFLRSNKFLVAAVLSVVLQSAAAAPVTVDLTQFTSGAGVRIQGGNAGSATGHSLAVIGDHNGDGFQDYMFGVTFSNLAVIVMKRNTTYTAMTSDSIVSGEFYRVLKGPASSGAGRAVGGIGDINDDGFDDVIVGASGGSQPGRTGARYAFVIFGMKGPFTDVIMTSTWAASSVGFMILGASSDTATAFAITPNSMRGIGDVNGDGIDDFAVGDQYFAGTSSKTQCGVVWVIFGKKNTAFTTIDLLPANFGSNGVYYTGAADGTRAGFTLSHVGDFNGDGIADFLMNGYFADPVVNGVTRTDAGVVHLIFGSTTALATTDLSTFTSGSIGVRFIGANNDDNLGRYLSGVGDVNDDGLADIAIGAGGGDPPTTPARSNAGIVYVIFGTTVAFTADFDLKNFNAFDKGFAIYGRTFSVTLLSAAPAGDINQDGVNDLLVGAISDNGDVEIVYGQREVRTAHVDLFTASVTTFIYTNGASLGWSLDGGRDLNGDGISDILMAGYKATVTPIGGGTDIANAGAIWMLPGPFVVPTEPPTTAPTAVPSLGGSSAPSAGPSCMPTRTPSVVPSAAPSAAPSVNPSADPSAAPSVDPSVAPSAAPSVMPSVNPSANPTVNPSAAPSVEPSMSPSVSPTVNPSATPSMSPTAAPSAVPSFAPTAVPSAVPTIRPTNAADVGSTLTVNVEQEAYFVDKDKYNAQQAAYNKTIQHTVADAVDGATPERVTDIVVEEEEEEGGRTSVRTGVRSSATARPVLLKYKVTVTDPLYTAAQLRAELVQAAQEGKMDANLRFYAAQFGATGLNNATLAVPQVTNAAGQRDSSEQLTGVEIALLMIGVVMALCLVVFGVWWRRTKTANTNVLPVAQNNSEVADC